MIVKNAEGIKIEWRADHDGFGSMGYDGWYRGKWKREAFAKRGIRKIPLGILRKVSTGKFELSITRTFESSSFSKAQARAEVLFRCVAKKFAAALAKPQAPRWNSLGTYPEPNQEVIVLIRKADHSLRVKGCEFACNGIDRGMWFFRKGEPVKGQVIGWMPWPEYKEVSHE